MKVFVFFLQVGTEINSQRGTECAFNEMVLNQIYWEQINSIFSSQFNH